MVKAAADLKESNTALATPAPKKKAAPRKAKSDLPLGVAEAHAAPASDPLDQLAAGDIGRVIALMLWKDRHRNPDLSVHITAQDIAGFEACVRYLEVTPEVKILRPPGRPAMPAIPPSRTNPNGWPARPAEAPRPHVFVGLVQKGSLDGFKPIENNEEDARRRDQANRLRRLKETGPGLAREMVAMAQSGTFSTATIEEAAQAIMDLAALA